MGVYAPTERRRDARALTMGPRVQQARSCGHGSEVVRLMPCELCEPAPHANCETYAQAEVTDLMTGESRVVDVCLEHYEVIAND